MEYNQKYKYIMDNVIELSIISEKCKLSKLVIKQLDTSS